MQKIISLIILSLSICFINAQTPITLTNSNMPGSGDTLRFTNAQLNSIGNYTQTGINYTWNFYNLISTTSQLRSFKSSFQTPYAFYFLGLNEYGEKIADTLGAGPITINNYWNFYKKQTTPVNAFIADGSGMTFSSIPVPSYFSDKDELYNFPMTYPKYDSTTFKFSTITSSLIPITYSKKGYRVTKVDGWGKVITPYDTVNCLRLITTQYSNDTIKTSIGNFNIPFGFKNYLRSYQWFSLNSKIPFLEVTGNLVGTVFTVSQVKYRGYKKQAVAPPPPPPPPIDTGVEELIGTEKINLFPNPVNDKLCLTHLTNTECLVEILDVNGKILKKDILNSAQKIQFLDVSEILNGVYLLKATQNKNIQYLKFIIVR